MGVSQDHRLWKINRRLPNTNKPDSSKFGFHHRTRDTHTHTHKRHPPKKHKRPLRQSTSSCRVSKPLPVSSPVSNWCALGQHVDIETREVGCQPGHLSEVTKLPTQTMHYYKGKSLKLPYIFILWSPPKWVPFNDPFLFAAKIQALNLQKGLARMSASTCLYLNDGQVGGKNAATRHVDPSHESCSVTGCN